MSQETYDEVREAIAKHIADETDGNLLTDWVVLTASVGKDMSLTHYVDMCADNSPEHTLEGLILKGLIRITQRSPDG